MSLDQKHWKTTLLTHWLKKKKKTLGKKRKDCWTGSKLRDDGGKQKVRRVSGRIVTIRQNQGPAPIRERQYGAKVKSGVIQQRRQRLPEENIGQSSFYTTLKI